MKKNKKNRRWEKTFDLDCTDYTSLKKPKQGTKINYLEIKSFSMFK